MVALRTDLQNAFRTTLTAQMGPNDLVASVAAVGLLTGDFYLCIEVEDDGQREYIFFDGTHTGSSFVTTSISNRYLEGSAATSNLTHPIGSSVVCVPTSFHFADLHDRIEAHLGGTAVTDHPVATVSVRGFMSAADKTKLDGIETAATADQTAAEILAALLTVDGAGSLLDADLLDGVEGSGYSLAGHTHGTFVPAAGGTFTGLVDFDAGASFGAQIYGDTGGDWFVRRAAGDDVSLRLLAAGPRLMAPNNTSFLDINNSLVELVAANLEIDASAGHHIRGDGVGDFNIWNGPSSAAPRLFLGAADARLYAPNNVDYLKVDDNLIEVIGAQFRVDTGEIYGDGTDLYLRSSASGNNHVRVNGPSDLIQSVIDGTARFAVTGSGADVTGAFTVSGDAEIGGGDLWGNGNVMNIRAASGGTDFLQVDALNSLIQNFINNVEELRIDSSGIMIQELFPDVGNVETLRADRTTGGLTRVGYFSSSRKGKTAIRRLGGKRWKPEWFDRIRPVEFRRTSGGAKGVREFGFVLEELEDISTFLTTAGDKRPGFQISEVGMLAVTVDAVQRLAARIAALEGAT